MAIDILRLGGPADAPILAPGVHPAAVGDRHDDAPAVRPPAAADVVPRSAAGRCWPRPCSRSGGLGQADRHVLVGRPQRRPVVLRARLVLLLSGLILLALAHDQPADDRAGEFFGAS